MSTIIAAMEKEARTDRTEKIEHKIGLLKNKFTKERLSREIKQNERSLWQLTRKTVRYISSNKFQTKQNEMEICRIEQVE